MRRIVMVGLGLLCVAQGGTKAAPPERPNILIILADDLGYADVGFQGCADVATPRIDSLATGGVRCSSGYVSHSFCSPTRAGLMTGRYQQRFGHENNPTFLPEDSTVGLPRDQVTIAQILHDSGYVTGAIGKWHLGAAPCFRPNQRGFDEYYGLLGGGHQYMPVPLGPSEYAIAIRRNDEPVESPAYLTDAFGQEAAAFIQRHHDKPWFLYLAFNAVHTPLQAPDKVIAKYDSIADPNRKVYAAMLDALDRAVGVVLDELERQHLTENTLVVFLSDNGGPLDANASSNGLLRGAKGQVYEGGIRVPFAARFPARIAAGTTYDQPVISLDLAPTAAALAGAAVPDSVRFDGVDLMPYLTGQKQGAPHDRLHWRQNGSTPWAVREGNWKLLQLAKGMPELYNLDRDLSETTDLAAAEPEVVKRLLAAHEAWNSELVAPRFQSPRSGRPAARKAAEKAAPAKKAAAKKAAGRP